MSRPCADLLDLQDVVFVIEDMWVGQAKWSLYCVCDGHGGSAAAEYVQDSLPGIDSIQQIQLDGFMF